MASDAYSFQFDCGIERNPNLQAPKRSKPATFRERAPNLIAKHLTSPTMYELLSVRR